jgi:hypothetical protein
MSAEPDVKRQKREPTGAARVATSPVTPVEIISLLDSDEDDNDNDAVVATSDGSGDDVMIVPVSKPVETSVPMGGGLDVDVDDDLQAVGVLQTTVVYPHARADCRTRLFSGEASDEAHDKNVQTCDKCYCYVCDVEASNCKAWNSHCMACDRRTAWRNLRTRKRSKPNQPIDVPSLLLPPRLRGSASRTAVGGGAGPSDGARALYARTKARQAAQANMDRRAAFVLKTREDDRMRAEKRARDVAKYLAGAIPSAGKAFTFRPRTQAPPAVGQAPLPKWLTDPEKRSFIVGAMDFWRPYCSHRNVHLPKDMTSSSAQVGLFHLAEGASNPYTGQVLAREVGIDMDEATFWSTFHSAADLQDGHGLHSKLRALFPPHLQAPVHSTFTADKQRMAAYVWEALDTAVTNGLVSVRWESSHYDGSANPNDALSSYHACLAPSLLGEKLFEETVLATRDWRSQCDSRVRAADKFDTSNCCRLRAWVSLLPAAFSSSNVRVANAVADPDSPCAYHAPLDGGITKKKAPAGDSWGSQVASTFHVSVLGQLMTQVKFADFVSGAPSLAPTRFLPKSYQTPLLKSSFRGAPGEDAKLVAEHENAFRSPSALIGGGDSLKGQKLFSIEGILSSPLFTVSEGYAGGSAPQPANMSVTLRPYQLETLKWMQDQEARSSISDPFWVKLTMLPLYNSALAAGPSTRWEPFWYCPLTGNISRLPPPRVVGGILSEEMGLGKTVEVISLLTDSLPAARGRPVTGAGTRESPLHSGTTLIVTPVSLLHQWRAELARRAKPGALNVCLWYGGNRPKVPREMAKYDVLLTTYSTMASRRSAEALEGLSFYRIVIDESTYVKGGASTSLYQSLMRLQCPRRWAVSGTPFANDIRTLLPVVRFLGVSPFAHDKLLSPMLDDFTQRLSTRHVSPRTSPDTLPVMPTAAFAYVLKSLMMRHCKRQELNGRVLVELPPSSGRMVKVTLTPPERVDYDRAQNAAAAASLRFLKNDHTVNRSIIALHAQLLPVRMATTGIVRTGVDEPQANGTVKRVYSTRPTPGAAKIAQLLADIRSIREGDPVAKFVVFTENDPLKKQLNLDIAAAGIGVSSLDGSMPAAQRGRILANMASDPELVVLLLSSKFAHGLNLTWANIICTCLSLPTRPARLSGWAAADSVSFQSRAVCGRKAFLSRAYRKRPSSKPATACAASGRRSRRQS